MRAQRNARWIARHPVLGSERPIRSLREPLVDVEVLEAVGGQGRPDVTGQVFKPPKLLLVGFESPVLLALTKKRVERGNDGDGVGSRRRSGLGRRSYQQMVQTKRSGLVGAEVVLSAANLDSPDPARREEVRLRR